MAASIAIEIESGSSANHGATRRDATVRHDGYWAGTFTRDIGQDPTRLVRMASDLQRWTAQPGCW